MDPSKERAQSLPVIKGTPKCFTWQRTEYLMVPSYDDMR
jgi:hypothetical protein